MSYSRFSPRIGTRRPALLMTLDTMQYCPEADIASNMASDSDYGLGNRCNIVGGHAEHGWLLRCTICPRYDREWSLPWSRLLSLDVVPEGGAALPNLALLQRRVSSWSLWRYPGLGEIIDQPSFQRTATDHVVQGISHMNGVGNLDGWRWIFVLEGLLTVVVSLAAYFFIHNYPSTATFLTEDERQRIHDRLKASNDATRDEAFSWKNVRGALADPKVLLYGLGFHTMSLPLYTLSLFLPTIIKALGYTAAQAQLLTVPPYSVAFVMTLTVAIASEKTKIRAPFIMGTSALAVIGYIVLLTNSKPSVAYFGTVLAAAGIYPSVAIVLSWPANNVSGQTKRATANALQISIGNLGALLGTQLYRSTDGPRFFLGHSFELGYLCMNVVVVGTLWAVLRAENARRDRGERNHRLDRVAEDEWLGDDDPRWRFQT